MRSHNGGFTRAFMEVLVVDDHTGSDAWVVHSVAVGVRGTSSSFSLSPRLVRGVGSLGLPQHTDAVWLNTQLQYKRGCGTTEINTPTLILSSTFFFKCLPIHV